MDTIFDVHLSSARLVLSRRYRIHIDHQVVQTTGAAEADSKAGFKDRL